MENVNSMSSAASVVENKKSKTSIKKILLYILVGIAAIALICHLLWIKSGNSQWEVEIEGKNAVVYGMKEPGSTLKKFRGVTTVSSNLAGIVKLMRDPDSCDDVGCYDSKIIDGDNPSLQYYSFKYAMPGPFSTREYVVKSEYRQDPTTKEIFVDYTAAPDKAPADDCCVRVTHMNNTWRFTPKEDGKIEVEYLVDMGPGGALPYFLANVGAPGEIYWVMANLQKILDKEKYKQATLDYVMEVE